MSNRGKLNFFQNAQSPTIYGGVFTAVQGNAHIVAPNLSPADRRGMKILMDHIASGAFHDAAERGDPPKCHPDTRKSLITEIMEWRLQEHHQFNSVLWLNGPAGAGKSAIMQTIAEMCALEEALGGSFFFARTSPERNNPSRFIATLVYQIIQVFPDLQECIVDAIEADQAIFTRKLETQVEVLIVHPLNRLAQLATLSGPDPLPCKLFVIDALDECQTGAAQCEVVNAIMTILSCVDLPTPPFIFLVSSRPEYEIRRAFSWGYENIKLQPDYDADVDIETFLQSTFRQIRNTHPIRSRLPLDWPTEQQMRYLVETSSGQFIYAATAAQYINSPRHNPFVRLSTILTPRDISISKDNPFAQLDTLYRLVLAAVTEISIVLQVLTFLILRKSERTLPTIEFVSILFGLEPDDVRLALMDMYALMNVPATDDDKEDVLRIHHASMIDFLTDPSRSREFHIDPMKGNAHLATSFLKCITRIQDQEDSSDMSLLDPVLAGFIAHYPHARLTEELKSALDNFNIKLCLAGMSPTQFYDTEWNGLFACLAQNEYSKGAIREGIQRQFDISVGNRLRQYPDIIQTCIPAAYSIFPQYFLNSTEAVFAIICGSQISNLLLLDKPLFQFSHRDVFEPLADFFNDHARAGEFFPTPTHFKKLAQEIVENIFPKEQSFRARFIKQPLTRPRHRDEEDKFITIILGGRFCGFYFFEPILAKCPNNLELALFLRERVLQVPLHSLEDDITEGRLTIGKAGLQYIKDCGVSYSTHTHIPELHQCLICDEVKKTDPNDFEPSISDEPSSDLDS